MSSSAGSHPFADDDCGPPAQRRFGHRLPKRDFTQKLTAKTPESRSPSRLALRPGPGRCRTGVTQSALRPISMPTQARSPHLNANHVGVQPISNSEISHAECHERLPLRREILIDRRHPGVADLQLRHADSMPVSPPSPGRITEPVLRGLICSSVRSGRGRSVSACRLRFPLRNRRRCTAPGRLGVSQQQLGQTTAHGLPATREG